MTLTEDGLLLRKRAEDIISEKTTFNKDIYMGCGEIDEISMIVKAFISYKIIPIFFKHSSRLITKKTMRTHSLFFEYLSSLYNFVIVDCKTVIVHFLVTKIKYKRKRRNEL